MVAHGPDAETEFGGDLRQAAAAREKRGDLALAAREPEGIGDGTLVDRERRVGLLDEDRYARPRHAGDTRVEPPDRQYGEKQCRAAGRPFEA